MRKVLVPIDGSENSMRAIQHAISMAKLTPCEIHVLSVQLPIRLGEEISTLSRDAIDSYLHRTGDQVLDIARDVMQRAGVPCFGHVKIGDIATTITDFAVREKMDEIVMGTRGMSTFRNLMLGSIASKVIHLAAMPVTLVK